MMTLGKPFAKRKREGSFLSSYNWLALGITMAIPSYIDACGLCLIIQGRCNFLESGLHIFEIILFLKI